MHDAAIMIEYAELAHVCAGNDALGRCGPGSRWRWLGDIYTPECLAHDQAVKDNLAQGQSKVGAHLRALPGLPAAIGSWVRERFRR